MIAQRIEHRIDADPSRREMNRHLAQVERRLLLSEQKVDEEKLELALV